MEWLFNAISLGYEYNPNLWYSVQAIISSVLVVAIFVASTRDLAFFDKKNNGLFCSLIMLILAIYWGLLYSLVTASVAIADYTHQKNGYITIFDLNASQLKIIDDFYVKQAKETERQENIYKTNQRRKEEIQKQKIIKEIK